MNRAVFNYYVSSSCLVTLGAGKSALTLSYSVRRINIKFCYRVLMPSRVKGVINLSKQQLFFLALALIVGSFLGFLVGNSGIASRTSAASTLQTVSKTITITQFTCSFSNYDTDIGQFCPVDKISLAHQPASMNCISVATSSPSLTLSEKCDPNGSLIGNPFFVAWKNGFLELMVEDGTYNFNPPRVVTYSAVV